MPCRLAPALAGLACTLPLATQAIRVCELDAQPVNPANGSTTAGKTGSMRCREGDGGPVVREQELQRGVDARGRISRERELDETGRATRDDEVFADGSRKACAR